MCYFLKDVFFFCILYINRKKEGDIPPTSMKRMSLRKCRRSTEETCFIQSSSWEFLFVHQKYVEKYDNCMIIKRKLSDTTFWIFRRTLPWSAFTWLPSILYVNFIFIHSKITTSDKPLLSNSFESCIRQHFIIIIIIIIT